MKSMLFKRSLFIFRRDLRLFDNTALISALQNSEIVIPVFILDPRQIQNQPYLGHNCLQFMNKSLVDLDQQLVQLGSRLELYYGNAEEVLPILIKDLKIESIFLNYDYTPFSRKRDETISSLCKAVGIKFCAGHDLTLTIPGSIISKSKTPYTIYTPFYKTASLLQVPAPVKLPNNNFSKIKIEHPLKISIDKINHYLPITNTQLRVKGGRGEGLELLDRLNLLSKYQQERDFPAIYGTSLLSAHHKFGTVSIRETWHKIKDLFGSNTQLIKELYWRDFFTQIAYNFPRVFKGAFNEKYNQLEWSDNQENFDKWCQGQTGFPIIDAGMRELNTTGLMHNRVRMIVASFLTKDLQISWQQGERYFAQKLVDYDPAVNNGNWQWAASTGCDAQPYFRIFNPWLQQQRFDPEAIYLKKWIPELEKFSPKQLSDPDFLINQSQVKYPKPIVDHQEAKAATLAMFDLDN